jgi:hypothetical protein
VGEYAAHEAGCCHAKSAVNATPGSTCGRHTDTGRNRRARRAAVARRGDGSRPAVWPYHTMKNGFTLRRAPGLRRRPVAGPPRRGPRRGGDQEQTNQPQTEAANGRGGRPRDVRSRNAISARTVTALRVRSALIVSASPLAATHAAARGYAACEARTQNSEIDPAATIFYRGRPSGLPAHALAALDLDPVTLPMADFGSGHSETEAPGRGGAGPGATTLRPLCFWVTRLLGHLVSGVPHRRVVVDGCRFSATAIHPHIMRRGSL